MQLCDSAVSWCVSSVGVMRSRRAAATLASESICRAQSVMRRSVANRRSISASGPFVLVSIRIFAFPVLRAVARSASVALLSCLVRTMSAAFSAVDRISRARRVTCVVSSCIPVPVLASLDASFATTIAAFIGAAAATGWRCAAPCSGADAFAPSRGLRARTVGVLFGVLGRSVLARSSSHLSCGYLREGG